MSAPPDQFTTDHPISDIMQAADYADRVMSDYGWSLGHGAPAAGGPRWCFAVFPGPEVEFPDNMEPLAMAEHDNPLTAVMEAAIDLGLVPERKS